ncbi:MAG: radical SAM family heme chaperone HemW [Coriobacteriia bacterium]
MNRTATTGRAGGFKHLYVHVPFCAGKCAYCDFFSVVPRKSGPGADWARRFVEAALRQVSDVVSAGLLEQVESVYVGGGTPTLLREEAPRLVAGLLEMVGSRGDVEVTVEANPESLDGELAEALVASGATRLSLGVQSLDDRVLALLGRRHSARDALRALGEALAAGADVSVDLICGVPGQSVSSWERTLREVASRDVAHVSVYALEMGLGTELERRVRESEVVAPDPDVAAGMMAASGRLLGEAGFQRYETSNYARPGKESRHNSAYWTGRAYAAIGPGAHGMCDVPTARSLGLQPPEGAHRVRYEVLRDIEQFLALADGGAPAGERGLLAVEALLDEREALIEDVVLGLRRTAGVRHRLVVDAGLEGALAELAGVGLVMLDANRWRPTERGWLLGNEVAVRVLEAAG